MDNSKIKTYFDRLAAEWDFHSGDHSETIGLIFDSLGSIKGKDVLDVACGTGVLIPEYRKREAGSLDCIDLSEGMLQRAKEKYGVLPVRFLLGDAQTYPFEKQYDLIMVYNAFPHFTDPFALVKNAARHLKDGGIFAIAHSMGREELNRVHCPDNIVSCMLMPMEELTALVSTELTVTEAVSNEQMYLLVARKEEKR